MTVACDGDLDGEFDGSVFHDGEFDGKVDGEVDGPSKCPSRCPSRQNKAYFNEISLISIFRPKQAVNLTVDLSVNLTVTKREPVNLTVALSVNLTVKHRACATRNLKFIRVKFR